MCVCACVSECVCVCVCVTRVHMLCISVYFSLDFVREC